MSRPLPASINAMHTKCPFVGCQDNNFPISIPPSFSLRPPYSQDHEGPHPTQQLVERPTTACFPQTMCFFPWCDLNSGEVEGNWHSSSQRGNISKKERGRLLGRLDSENARDRPDLLQFSINKNWQCFFDSPLSKCLPSSEIRCYVRDCEARLPLRMMDGCVGSWTMNRLLISGEQLSVIFCLS